jgi:hypothetical protein
VSEARQMNAPLDVLSAISRQVLKLDAPTAYARLTVSGSGNVAAKDLLELLTPQQVLSRPAASPDDAAALLAGLWLWHDWLNESHRLSQNILSATGSFWHSIMHRREADFSNSKYWYARCASHPALAVLTVQAGELINPHPADKSILRLIAHGWDPAAFVDLVQDVYEQPEHPRHRLAVALQQLEWRVLFDHTTRAAAGG